MTFRVEAPYQPTGDQPEAIRKLVNGLKEGYRHQTLLGATGTGKTAVMAWIFEQSQRPTLVLAHNKTLVSQLWAEFRDFLPDAAVEMFISYYDEYTPEAYVPSKDLYIEKEASINEEIDRLRHAATQALFTRRDVLIVASVSAIFGLGSPQDYGQVVIPVRAGEVRNRDKLLRQLIDLQFERNDIDFHRGTFRVRGDTLDIMPANSETAVRIEFWGDEVERIVELDPLTGEILLNRTAVDIYPAKHFVTTKDKLAGAVRSIQDELGERLRELEAKDKVLEAARLKQRTMYDLEMLGEVGYCSGIENYSRHMDGRSPGQTPWTLFDYFPDDFLLFVDESHISLPQVRGMYKGDRSRKETLVDFGFRLPSALDNRPTAVRGVRAARLPGDLRLGHPRPLRARAQRADRRADHPAHRPGRPDHRGAAQQGPGGRPGGRDPQARREGPARPRHHPHQAHGRGPGRLPQGDGRADACTCTPTSTRWSGSRSCATCAWACTMWWSASTCCARASTCPRSAWWPSSTPTRRASCARRPR